MKTETTTAQIESKTIFIDDGTPWKIGKTCLKAVEYFPDGTTLATGDVIFGYDRQTGQSVYTARGADGADIFDTTPKLSDLKRRFIEQKAELIALARMVEDERALDPVLPKVPKMHIPWPYADEQKQQKRQKETERIRDAKSKSKSKSRTR